MYSRVRCMAFSRNYNSETMKLDSDWRRRRTIFRNLTLFKRVKNCSCMIIERQSMTSFSISSVFKGREFRSCYGINFLSESAIDFEKSYF